MERHTHGTLGGLSVDRIKTYLDAERLESQANGLTPETVRIPWSGLLECLTCQNLYFWAIPESVTKICTRCRRTYEVHEKVVLELS